MENRVLVPFEIKIIINDIEYKPVRNTAEMLQDFKGIMGHDCFELFAEHFIFSLTEDIAVFTEILNLAHHREAEK